MVTNTIKLQELRSLLYQKDYDPVLLTEVCPMNLRTRLEDSHINMAGYQVVSNLSCTGYKSSIFGSDQKYTCSIWAEQWDKCSPCWIYMVWVCWWRPAQCYLRFVPIEACFNSQPLRLRTLSLISHPAIENFTGDFIIGGNQLPWTDLGGWVPLLLNC